jgi:hypothetical protein
MKNYFLSLFNEENRLKTTSFLATTALLVFASQLVGTTDNLPGIGLLLGGMIFLFFSFLHPWKKVEYYAILIGACVGLIVLVMFGIQVLVWLKKTEYISEGVVMTIIFLFCLPGILTGIIGTLICAFRKK